MRANGHGVGSEFSVPGHRCHGAVTRCQPLAAGFRRASAGAQLLLREPSGGERALPGFRGGPLRILRTARPERLAFLPGGLVPAALAAIAITRGSLPALVDVLAVGLLAVSLARRTPRRTLVRVVGAAALGVG